MADRDIATPEDVAEMVRAFYRRVYADDLLRPLFQDVAGVDLEEHLPKMNRFWETVLFGTPGYRGDPLLAHRQLDRLSRLNECHFLRWIGLFNLTVDELFRGPGADRAKRAAMRISERFQVELAVRPMQRAL